MPRVKISANLIEVPPVCACCGFPSEWTFAESAARTKGKRNPVEEVKSQPFGLCKHCLAHMAFIAPPGTSPSTYMPGAWDRFEREATSDQRAKLATMRRPQCQAADCIADFVTWEGTVRTFRFDSRAYAERFARENAAAGRNVLGVDLDSDPSPIHPTAPWGPPPAPVAAAPVMYYPPPAYPVPPRAPSGPRPAVVLIAVLAAITGLCVLSALVSKPDRVPIRRPDAAAAVAPAVEDDAGTAAPERPRRRHRRRRAEVDAGKD